MKQGYSVQILARHDGIEYHEWYLLYRSSTSRQLQNPEERSMVHTTPINDYVSAQALSVLDAEIGQHSSTPFHWTIALSRDGKYLAREYH